MIRQALKKIACASAIFIATLSTVQAADHEIKWSILAPEGSAWAKIMEEMRKEVVTNSGGKVDFKIYAGGVSGDEKDVLRKMRVGQIHAAGFTGVGLGEIVPAVRVLELPLLFRSYQEADAVKEKIRPELEKQFSDKGFELLGWAEAGFINIYSNKAIKNKEDLKGVKMWMWQGDPLSKAMFSAMEISPVPLALTDVLTSLQTNMIDGVYAPPLALLALQWSGKVKYVTNIDLANSTGALVISKAEFGKLPADLQKVVKDAGQKYSKKLVDQLRSDNAQALNIIKKNGIQVVEVDPAAKAELIKVSESVYPQLVGKLYSAELLQKVQDTLKALR